VAGPQRWSSGLFRFLDELAVNNDRSWFKANRDHYENDVRRPALDFIVAMGPQLRRISPHFEADPRPVGGSLFRIYRDIRFSQDKSPYKDHVGIQFRHEAGRSVHAPGYYVHLQPRNCFVAVGIWRPDTPAAKRIRSAIADRPQIWAKAVARLDEAGWQQTGESLKRPPQGFPKDHPLVEELMRKSWIAVAPLRQSDVVRADFPRRLGDRMLPSRPYLEFLSRALDLPF
jgi:uncharacterized protein (TIGR02453 family)